MAAVLAVAACLDDPLFDDDANSFEVGTSTSGIRDECDDECEEVTAAAAVALPCCTVVVDDDALACCCKRYAAN